jgi:hypothetical protein
MPLHDRGRERLDPAGTGTLVVIGRRHYILTAAQVWDVLKSALKLGITLIDNRHHKTWIDINTIVPWYNHPVYDGVNGAGFGAAPHSPGACWRY